MMLRLGFLTAMLCGLFASSSTPLHACSVSWKKGHSPKEVRRSPYVKKITGIYRVEQLAGDRRVDEDGVERVRNAGFLGTLTSVSGRVWKIVHKPLLETGVTCVDVRNAEFRIPEDDAQGTFWIETRKTGGRHKLRDWDGDYLETKLSAEKKD